MTCMFGGVFGRSETCAWLSFLFSLFYIEAVEAFLVCIMFALQRIFKCMTYFQYNSYCCQPIYDESRE